MTEEDTYAALCVWEAMLEKRVDVDKYAEANDDMDTNIWFKMSLEFDLRGACAMRRDAMFIGVWVEKVWRIVSPTGRFDDCFDWVFVPKCVELRPEWNECPDPEKTAKLFIENHCN